MVCRHVTLQLFLSGNVASLSLSEIGQQWAMSASSHFESEEGWNFCVCQLSGLDSYWYPDPFPLNLRGIIVAVTDIMPPIRLSFYLFLPQWLSKDSVFSWVFQMGLTLCLYTSLMRTRIVTVPCDLTADMKYGNDPIASDAQRTQKVINLSVCL